METVKCHTIHMYYMLLIMVCHFSIQNINVFCSHNLLKCHLAMSSFSSSIEKLCTVSQLKFKTLNFDDIVVKNLLKCSVMYGTQCIRCTHAIATTSKLWLWWSETLFGGKSGELCQLSWSLHVILDTSVWGMQQSVRTVVTMLSLQSQHWLTMGFVFFY